MIAALTFLAISQAPALTIADFYPLNTGTKWTYEEENNRLATYTDEARPMIKIGDKMVTPIHSFQSGKLLGSVFYAVEGDTVYVVAYEAEKPLPKPHPVLKFSGDGVKWTFEGQTVFMRDMLPIKLEGSSARKGTKDCFGAKREILEVNLNASIFEVGGVTIKVNQKITYARGIGMIEMIEKGSYGRETNERKVKLVSFEPGG